MLRMIEQYRTNALALDVEVCRREAEEQDTRMRKLVADDQITESDVVGDQQPLLGECEQKDGTVV